MPTIAAAQQKGGVGKTTMILNLACQAAAKKFTTAILDVDTDQASALEWGERRKQNPNLKRIDVYAVRPSDLKGRVADLKAKGVQWLFVDLPGRDNPSISAGLNVADLALVPCRPLEDDIRPSLRTVGLIRRGGGRYAYVMNIAPKRRAEKVSEALRAAGHPVAPVIITQKISVPDANTEGMGINEMEPSSESAKEFAALFKWIRGQV